MIHSEGELVKLVESTNKKLDEKSNEEINEYAQLVVRPLIGLASKIAARQAVKQTARRTAQMGLRKELQKDLERGVEKGVEKGTRKGMEMGVDKAKEYITGNPEDQQNMSPTDQQDILPSGVDQQDLHPTLRQKASSALLKGLEAEKAARKIMIGRFIGKKAAEYAVDKTDQAMDYVSDKIMDRGEEIYNKFSKKDN